MGIIIRQSIKGSIWSYLGVGIGFVTTSYLFPKYLTTDTIGLLSLLTSWSILSAQFSSLGFGGVTARLFPYFRNKKKGHNGFLFISSISMVLGFILFLIIFLLLAPWLEENNAEKSRLFSEYIYLIIPLTFFILLYNRLDVYTRLLYNAILGIFLVEFLQRLLIFIIVLLFVVKWISLHQLVLAYSGAICIKGIVIIIYLFVKGELNLKPQLNFVNKKLRHEMISVAFFSILTGLGGSFIFIIDKILVNQMLGLSATGIYSIGYFFGTLILLPSRPLQRISGTLIAEAWKKNDIRYITNIYKQSCLNQFIIGSFLFGGIWVNINNIVSFLGPDYITGKWVIFFVGLGTLINMATGINNIIIAYSKYYRMALWFLLVQVIVFLSSMYLLVPVWKITGAGIAIALSFTVHNLIRYIFLYKKYKMQPFTYQFLVITAASLISYFIAYYIPKLPMLWDILFRGGTFGLILLSFIIGLKVSPDMNATINKIFQQVGFKK